jgi:TonB family protein
MQKKTKVVAPGMSLLFSICLAISQSSFSATVTGMSPSGNEIDVEITESPNLKYPRRAERLGVEGYVVIGFDLSADGELIDLRVIKSDPRFMFDKAALKFVEGMKFAIPEEDGEPVMTRDIQHRIRFQLQ